MNRFFDVIIVGGSYAGLATAMALGRALKSVLVIDSGLPCNRQTPHSHNFLTQDGSTPKEISTLALSQVRAYDTVTVLGDVAIGAQKAEQGFDIQTASGKTFSTGKLVFATGIRDLLPPIPGLSECWGISVLHCPFCHGYEVRNEPTGILGSGEQGFELARLISNWTPHLTLFTNGPSTLGPIPVEEKGIASVEHRDGYVQHIVFTDHSIAPVKAIYIRPRFEQHCKLPEALGCELTPEGYLKTDGFQETTVSGVYACGDNASPMRTVASAVASGTATGLFISRKIILA